MRVGRAHVSSRRSSLPALKFESQQLTSFGGLVVVQALIQQLDLAVRLRRCFLALPGVAYSSAQLFVQLVVGLLSGFRFLRHRDPYAEDPMLLRVCRAQRMADVATLSRRFGKLTDAEVDAVGTLRRDLVLERLQAERLRCITLDFDGSVLSTRKHAEGSAVGYNKLRKGARSYYPLFATVAQTSQFLDMHHRPGNVHDSNGSVEFVARQLVAVCAACPDAAIEMRLDSAFFHDAMLCLAERQGVAYSVSVPFDRFPELKAIVENTTEWTKIDDTWAMAECAFCPKAWKKKGRDCEERTFLLLRKEVEVQRKGPLQLDLFEPRSRTHEYKAIVTNKVGSPRAKLQFHNGRGCQEALLGEAKSCVALGYVPMRKLVANRLFLQASMLAHNLGRELIMRTRPRDSQRMPDNRAPLWKFPYLSTLRAHLMQRAGRLTRPSGVLTLTLAASDRTQELVTGMLKALAA